jgi:hypothetical protein
MVRAGVKVEGIKMRFGILIQRNILSNFAMNPGRAIYRNV